MPIRTLITIPELREYRAQLAEQGKSLALVPTMGALHEGHLSLVELAKHLADEVMVTIFVNPMQFGPSEDFAKYPRTLQADLDKLTGIGVNAVFAPNVSEMYPQGSQTRVYNDFLAGDLCGASRPGHFEGVLTIVAKLFHFTACHFAVFGKKDYQQLRIIERLVRDLGMPVQIGAGETQRDEDGLAKSSRNAYLDDASRSAAVSISRGLFAAAESFQNGERTVEALLGTLMQQLDPAVQPEYIEVREQLDLRPFESGLIDKPAVLLIAARVGDVRLIDNLELHVVEGAG